MNGTYTSKKAEKTSKMMRSLGDLGRPSLLKFEKERYFLVLEKSPLKGCCISSSFIEMKTQASVGVF